MGGRGVGEGVDHAVVDYGRLKEVGPDFKPFPHPPGPGIDYLDTENPLEWLVLHHLFDRDRFGPSSVGPAGPPIEYESIGVGSKSLDQARQFWQPEQDRIRVEVLRLGLLEETVVG